MCFLQRLTKLGSPKVLPIPKTRRQRHSPSKKEVVLSRSGRALKISFSGSVCWPHLDLSLHHPMVRPDLHPHTSLQYHSFSDVARKGRFQASRMLQLLANPMIKFIVSESLQKMWSLFWLKYSLQKRTGLSRQSDFGHSFSCSWPYLNSARIWGCRDKWKAVPRALILYFPCISQRQ